MTYICVKCRKTWNVGDPTDEYSGGICDDCITKYVRNKQLEKGFHDCFKRAVTECSRDECSYWDLCCRDLTKEG